MCERLSVALTTAFLSLITTFPGLAQEETTKEIVAAQIRSQGFACDKPQSATRDEQLSRPDEAVWILACENATYQVRLIPNMAANVQQLDQRK
jgi:hypothetical protein